MGLFDAIGAGVSQMGYAMGDRYAKGALMDTQNDAEFQRAAKLEQYKQLLKTSRQQAILGGPAVPVDTDGGGGSAAGASTPYAAGASPSAASIGATTGAIDAASLPAIAKQYGIPETALRYDLAMNEGKGISKMIEEAAKPDMAVTDNYAYNKKTLKEGFMPRVTQSADGKTIVTMPDGKGGVQVFVPAGAAEAYAQFTGIEKGASAATKPIKIYNPATKREEYVSEADALRIGQGGKPGAGGGDDRGTILTAERDKLQDMIANPKDHMSPRALRDDPDGRQFIARAKSDLAALEREAKTQGVQLGGAGGRLAAGPSSNEAASAAALKDLNTHWVKSFDAVQEAGKAADDMLTSVAVTRDAMKKLGGTGWGTEARANAANVLAGLGILGDKAKLYAGSAQQFQSAAMTRLWTTLNAAKGPQTEGDADRAKSTFASLKNTTQANEYILDLAQAQAERDKLRSAFYEAAQPSAREGGDLTVVDREWRQRSPSIFNMPSMQHWNVKQ